MKLQDAKSFMELKMEEHGLFEAGWQFEWLHSNHLHGKCIYAEKKLLLSTRLTSVNEEFVVKDTALHEIAHALVGPKHGHDDVWREKAIALGAHPRATCRNGHSVKMQGNLIVRA